MSTSFTPRVAKGIHAPLPVHTPEEPIQHPWDPRSPLLNRTPLNLVQPIDANVSSPVTVEHCTYNPLDPRSPLLTGNRTPIPMGEEAKGEEGKEKDKENEVGAKAKEGKEGKAGRKKKVVILSQNTTGSGGKASGGASGAESGNRVAGEACAGATRLEEGACVASPADVKQKSPIKRQIAFFDATNVVDS